jgi:hypothetical protein
MLVTGIVLVAPGAAVVPSTAFFLGTNAAARVFKRGVVVVTVDPAPAPTLAES